MNNHFNGYIVCGLTDDGEIEFDNELFRTGSMSEAESKVAELRAQGIDCDYTDLEVW